MLPSGFSCAGGEDVRLIPLFANALRHLPSRWARGVKKLERAFWPVNCEVASSTAPQFSVEIEFRQIGAG